MSIYTQIKKAVSIPEAAERFMLSVHNQTNCPLRQGPGCGIILSDDAYLCPECNAHGDVVDFVAGLKGISRWAAVQKIAMDFRLLPREAQEEPGNGEEEELDFFSDIDLDVFRNDAALVQKILLGYEWLLEEWQEEFAPVLASGPWDSRYAQARELLPTVRYLLSCLALDSFPERYCLVQDLLREDTIFTLRSFVERELEKRHGIEPGEGLTQ